MPRAGKVVKRKVQPDPIYGSRLLSKLVNKIMIDGKKSVAQSLVYGAMSEIEKSGKNPVTVLETAIANISPKMEVRPRRVGGASYQVPVEVRGDRREALAIRWLVEAARARSNREFHTFSQKLAAELQAATDNQGLAIKRREDTQRTAEANKAFAHFRW
ncbi:30S ribosomal protein S7 [Candidatus Daviesbacteria bacterium]|nr:30S ribosomal protein S7 [Candidatus Daviesbacteria bacterium]